MISSELCEDLQIWPVAMRLDRSWEWTLWSSAGEDDVVLAVCGTVLTFSTREGLLAFAGSTEVTTNLDDIVGFDRFRSAARRGSTARLKSPHFDLFNARELLGGGDWAAWTPDARRAVLEALDFAWDLAKAVSDEPGQRANRAGQPLGSLRIAIFGAEEDGSLLSQVDQQACIDSFDSLVGRFRVRWIRARVSTPRPLRNQERGQPR